MEILKNNILDISNIKKSLIRIGDVINIDGPLLTLFKSEENLYLFDWVDHDSQYNRWLIYRCRIEILKKFINKEMSHLGLLMNGDEYCFIVDIDKNINWHNTCKVIKKELPSSYLPELDNYFDESDCPNIQKFVELFSNRNNRKNRYKSTFNAKPYPIYYFDIELKPIDNQISILNISHYTDTKKNQIELSKKIFYNNKARNKSKTTKEYNYV